VFLERRKRKHLWKNDVSSTVAVLHLREGEGEKRMNTVITERGER